MIKMNKKIILGLMLVLVSIPFASSKNYELLDYMFNKNITFTDPIGKTMSELLVGARFFTLIHEDGSLERVGLQEESGRDGFDEDEISKRDKIRKGFGALVRGNYSFGPSEPTFNENSIGTAKVLVNETEVEIVFEEEYENAPIVTATPIGLPNFFYGVDEITTKGFKILISDSQEKEIVFNWHAFAQSLANKTKKDKDINKTKKINETLTNETEINETVVPENETIEINETEINETINLNESLVNETTNINETENNATEPIDKTNTITGNLAYQSGTSYDADDNGIESISEVIDFTVSNTKFNWEVNESNLCTRWSIYSLDAEKSETICYGSGRCCNFVEIPSTRDSWKEPIYLTYDKYGAGLNNTISAQTIYVDYSLDPENTYSYTYYSDWKHLSAVFYETINETFGNGTFPNEANVSKTVDNKNVGLVSITGAAILETDGWLNPTWVGLRKLFQLT